MTETHVENAYRPTKYRYNPARGGHAPGHLRDAFHDCLFEEEFMDGPESLDMEAVWHNGSMRSWRWLLGMLWNCTDIMPSEMCEELGLEAGSNYAQGVRSVRESLDS